MTGSPSSDPNVELELKFEIDSAHAARLRNAGWLKALQSGRASTRSLDATYYDTRGKHLHRHGLSLRVRKEGRDYKQTLKAQEGTAFSRNEWESLVPVPVPDRRLVFDNPEFRRLIQVKNTGGLEPVFETHVRRTTRRLVADGGTEIACDLDIGEITAGDNSKPITELELELKSGDPRSLFDIARKLAETVPVRLVKTSKAEQGYALIGDGAVKWRKQVPVVLPDGATGEDVLVRSVTACLNHLAANEDCVLQRAHIEGVHQARVALRRLRAALDLYKHLLPQAERKRLDKEVGAIAGGLGAARDWDVFATELLTPAEKAIEGEPYLALLRKEVERQRAIAHEHAAEALSSPEYTRMQIDVADFLYARNWRETAGGDAAAFLFGEAGRLAVSALDAAHGRLLERGRKIADMSKRDRHKLRIDVKKVRYAAEFFAPLYAKKVVSGYIGNLKMLQDILGAQNDIEMAREMINGLGHGLGREKARKVRYAGGLVVGWHAHAAKRRERSIMLVWTAIAETKPFWN